MDINGGRRPFFYPSGNPFIASNPRYSPDPPEYPRGSLDESQFYHVPRNIDREDQFRPDIHNKFGYYPDELDKKYDERYWSPPVGKNNPVLNNRENRPTYMMFPKLFGESKDITIEIDKRLPNHPKATESNLANNLPKLPEVIDIDESDVQKDLPKQTDLPEYDDKHIHKGIDVDVSPPFGKAYIPPSYKTDPNIILEDYYTSVEPIREITNITYDVTSYNFTSHPNETDFYGNNQTYLCGNDIDNLGNNVYLYGIGFLIVIAVLFNGLQFAVFRTKPLRKFAFSAYLSAVAVTDSLALFSHIPRRWMNILYQTLDWGLGVTVYDTNRIACRGLTYFSYVARFLSAWIVVALATERLMVSKDPYKRSKIRKPKIAIHALIGMLVVSLAVNCHVIFTWDVVPKDGFSTSVCAPAQESEMLSLFLTVLSLFSIVALPFVITIIITVIMLQNLQSNTWKLRPRKISVNTVNKLQFERKTVLMVSMITGVHSILSIPFIIAWIVLLGQHFTPSEDVCQYVKTYAAKDITEIIYMANCALKFVFCVFCGTNVVSYK